MATAVVVGTGPNGLAAAVRLAQHGIDVDGARSRRPHRRRHPDQRAHRSPALLHDHCSAFHPMAVGSPFLSTLRPGAARPALALARDRLRPSARRRRGRAAVALARRDRRASGRDGGRWRRLFGPLGRRLRRPRRRPDAPDRARARAIRSAWLRFGAPALLPAALPARAVAHRQGAGAVRRRRRPRVPPAAPADHLGDRDDASSPPGTATDGRSPRAAPSRSPTRWSPCSTTSAARSDTGVRVRTAGDIPPADVVLLDLAPEPSPASWATGCRPRVAPRLPPLPARPGRVQGRPRHRGRRAVDERRHAAAPAPSTSAAPSRRSPRTERDIAAGACRSGPSSSSASSTSPTRRRSAGDINPIWTYAHVPHGYTGDATEAILGQIERFAPGFRDRIVARAVRPTHADCPATTRTTSAATSSPAPTPRARS